ncbi:MAG: hypothetical protein ACKPE6_08755, partial [Gammaproteobacteria bacterium]
MQPVPGLARFAVATVLSLSCWSALAADAPSRTLPPAGSPNVVVVLLDDVGFGAAGTFGGAVETPSLDALARDG